VARLSLVTFLIDDYDRAIGWFTGALGFVLLEDTDLGGGKRWVRVAPTGDAATALLLARATTPGQVAGIGQQAGGRVAFFLEVEDFGASHAHMLAAGVHFLERPRQEAYGQVCVFEDPWGNRWDLLERGPTEALPLSGEGAASISGVP
jgi:catechol 2,3-dioxygenase-like lactoylglutathione lyase family enzyme